MFPEGVQTNTAAFIDMHLFWRESITIATSRRALWYSMVQKGSIVF